jgi:Flp pilus assembly protein TadG
MKRSVRSGFLNKNEWAHHPGQSLVEFALILPLFVLFIIGVFELGRAFFSYIAITNSAREGARVVTFWPGKTKISDVISAVNTELGSSPVIDVGKFDQILYPNSIVIACGSGNPMAVVTTDAALEACPSDQPVRVTLTYEFDLILSFFFPQPLMLVRSAEMMVP